MQLKLYWLVDLSLLQMYCAYGSRSITRNCITEMPKICLKWPVLSYLHCPLEITDKFIFQI